MIIMELHFLIVELHNLGGSSLSALHTTKKNNIQTLIP